MNHNSFAELYTQVKILSMIKIDDSISDMQRKTSFSFVTTQKAIKNLEKKQLIRTEKKINKKGKSRECIFFSKEHHLFCKKVITILDCLDLYLNNEMCIESDVEDLINELQKIKIEQKHKQLTLESY